MKVLKVFACLVVAMFTIVFGLIAFGGWYLSTVSIKAGDMFVERVQKDASGPKQMAVLAYTEDFCHIELPHALELALAKYRRNFPAEYDEAVTKLYQQAVDGGEDLQKEFCRMSRDMASGMKGLP